MKQYPSLVAWLAGPPRRTQELLAERLSARLGRRVRQGTVSKWVCGARTPRVQMREVIYHVTGVHVQKPDRKRAKAA